MRRKISRGDVTRHRILAAIQQYQNQHGVSPAYSELCVMVGISACALHEQVVKLRERGFINPAPKYKYRVLVLTRLDEPPEGGKLSE